MTTRRGKDATIYDDEPEGCLASTANRLILATAILLHLTLPCGTVVRQTTFTINGTPYPAKCLNAGHRTLGCQIYTD